MASAAADKRGQRGVLQAKLDVESGLLPALSPKNPTVTRVATLFRNTLLQNLNRTLHHEWCEVWASVSDILKARNGDTAAPRARLRNTVVSVVS